VTDSHADANEIILDGMRFKVVSGTLNTQELASFQRKIVTGDYTKESHPVLSSWVIDDLSGGHGMAKLKGTDLNRFRIGNLDVRKPSQWVLPPQAHQITGPNSDGCRVIGDLGGKFYLSYGTALRIWDETTDTHSAATGGTLTAIPVNKAIAFQGTAGAVSLFLPLGASGYDAYDGTTVTHVAGKLAQSFCIWDNKLLLLETNGQLWDTTDGTTWNTLGPTGKLDGAYTPRHIVPYYDRTNVPAPYVVTKSDLWAVDMNGPSLYRTELQYPPASAQGLGACPFRGDLYISVGMGAFRYNGAVVAPMGLDRDFGLPAGLRGKIVDLCNEYNGMYALVAGSDSISLSDESFLFDVFDDEIYVGVTTTISSLHVWTGFGWLEVWLSPDLGGTPSWIVVSDAEDTHRLWWGVGADAYTIIIPTDFTNPRSLIETGSGDFAESGSLETGRFNADMQNYPKIANAVEVDASYVELAAGRIDLQYKVNGESGFHVLGSVSTDGITVLQFGSQDGYGNAEGVEFNDIELRFLMLNGVDVTVSPLIDSAILTYLKVQSSTLDWTATLDLAAPWSGNSPEVMAAKVDELITSKRFFTMLHRDVPYRVRIAGWSGGQQTGQDKREQRQVSIIQIVESA
jgi:hypothetical protein